MTCGVSPLHLMVHVGTIQRVTTADDASGSPVGTWADIPNLIDIPFRFQPMSSAEGLRYGRESTRRMWKCFTEAGQDIVETDRIVFIDDTSGLSVTRTLDIQEIKNPQLGGVLLAIVGEETD